MGTELLNLAEAIGFEELFIEHMHLRPWHGPSAHLAFADIGPPQAGLVKAMQYLSDLRPEEDHLERLGQMVIRLFEADFVAFRDGSGPIRHVMVNAPGTCCPYEKDIADEAAMVLESGFMSILPPIPGRPASVVLMPMQVEEHTLVFVIGHEIPEEMPRDRLDIYLALARNAGAILTRLAQERELAAHRTHLAKLVEERTRELEKMNALLRTEMEMRARDEEAIRLANKKLNLLSSMTRHDIINQVTAVLGYVHLMETKGLPPEKMVRYLGKIEAVTTTIQRLIEFTRDYQDLGVRGPTWQQIDEDFWKAAVAFRDSGLTFTSDVEGVEIFSDQMLNKVFHNLIDNTIRHGEHARQCGLSYELDGDQLVLHYRDDGVGIPEEEKSLVFERGFGKNTGLGLFLVREILSITGIEIAEIGKLGKGVDFAIRVPPGGFRLRSGKAS
jgi:signal transduction histidine kinase